MTIAVSKLLRFVANGKNREVPQLLNSKVDLAVVCWDSFL